MPGFKLKSILSRVVLGESWRERSGSDYIVYARIENNNLESHSHVCTGSASDADDEDDDRNSINSFSTTATASNLPGAGRTVDTYIYQPVGRGIERLAKRLSSRRRTGSEDIGAVVTHSTTAAADIADNDDSASSINSFSTTATADNLAGTGRAIDTYIYQPLGRRIERLAMRFTILQCSTAAYFKFSFDAEHGMTCRLEVTGQGGLPKEVQIAYKTETGETQYMSFVPASPGPRRRPVSESFSIGSPRDESMDHKSNPVVVQDD